VTGGFRFAPRTITGQVTALVVLSVALALLISFASAYILLNRGSNERREPPLPPFAVIANMAAAASNESEIAAIIKNAERIGIPAQWLRGKEAKALLAKSKSFEDRFRRAVPNRTRPLRGPSGELVVALQNGDALAIRNRFGGGRPPSLPRFFAIPAIYALSIAAICILGLSLYAAYFITAPLTSLARVAATIGRTSEFREKVPEKSPLEIAKVAQALNEMHGRIQGLLDERTNMLTAISHDLRTPLTRMKLRAEKLILLNGSSVATQGMLDDITRMEQMLAETISYLRDDTKTEDLVAVDLPSFLQTICSELSDLGKAVTYQGPAKLVCSCRPSAISRAISNVIDNALKYGENTTVSLAALPDNKVRISITDDGPGLCYSHRIRVFEPFYKVDHSRTGASQGFGLGLSIAKKVVESHKGTVELFEVIPHGLKVEITLPAQAET
jgi:signal transduction histidine kinase